MKRPAEDESRPSSPEEKMEALLGGFLSQYPRLPRVIGIIIAILVTMGLVLAFK